VKAAYQYFVLGQKAPARALAERCARMLETAPNRGLCLMETDALAELTEAMDAAEQNSLDGGGPG
jgi:hypothetical protein